MLVRDIMSPNIITISSDTSLKECARRMDHFGVGAFPVEEHGKLVGFVTDRDMCCRGFRLERDPRVASVKDVMTPRIDSCFEDQNYSEAAEQMNAQHVRRLVVMSRSHRPIGIISIDDIARYSEPMAGKVIDLNSPICKGA